MMINEVQLFALQGRKGKSWPENDGSHAKSSITLEDTD